MNNNHPKVDNVLAHSARPALNEGRHVNYPIELGSTMVFNTMEAFEQAKQNRYDSNTPYYGRYGNTSSFELESILAELDEATGVTLTSSGLASITISLLALVHPGSHLLVADNVYGNTRAFCDSVLSDKKIDVEYFDPSIAAEVSSLFRENTQAIIFEAPGSGTFEFPDITSITACARAHGVLTILDATWPSPLFCRPLTLGVDVLVYSASKYISGHSDSMMGVVATRDQKLHLQIRRYVMSIGDKVGTHDVFLALRGLRTLKMRMQHVNNAGLEIAQWLQQQPQVKKILHPAFPDCPGHTFWKRNCSGSAGLFSTVFHPCSDKQIRDFVDGLQHFSIGVSWGGYESLALPVTPQRTATPWEEPGQIVRFNIGFEDTDSLKADLKQALTQLNTSGDSI